MHVTLKKSGGPTSLYEPQQAREIDPYERLAVAIVVKAAEDFETALRVIPPGKAYKTQRTNARRLRRDCESFFAGEWYDTLTNLPPEIAMRRAYTQKAIQISEGYVEIIHKARMKEWKKKRSIGRRKHEPTKRRKTAMRGRKNQLQGGKT